MTDIIIETPKEAIASPSESEKKPDTKVEQKTESEAVADSKPEETKEEEPKKEEPKKEETKIEETKIEETKKKEEVPETIDEGVLHKRAPRFMKLWSKSYFVFGTSAVSLEDLQVYYRKNAKKFAPTKKPTSGVTSTPAEAETTDTTAETSKPSEVVEVAKGPKEVEDKKPETKEVETSEVKESKESEDKKPEIEEIKEVKESEDKKPETKESETKETKESETKETKESETKETKESETKETKESEEKTEKTVDLNHVFYSNIAHATQTGEGLLFYYRSSSETHKKHPIGIINLKEVIDVKELHEHAMGKPFPFKVETSYRVFELAADSKSERDRWIKTIKEKVDKAKETNESVETSNGYKDTYDQLVKGTAFTATKPGEGVMADEVFSGDEVEDKPRSTEAKRKSIFPFFGGRKPSTSEATSTTITTTETTEDGGKVITTTTTSEIVTDETEEVKSDEPPKSPQRASKSFLSSIFSSSKKSEKEESATNADDAKEKEGKIEETTDAETAAATETTQQKEIKDHKDGGIMNKIPGFFKSKPKEETHKEEETTEVTKVDSTSETTPGDKVEESSEKKVEKESKDVKESEKKDDKKDDKKKKKKKETDDDDSSDSSSSSDADKGEPSLVRRVTQIFKRSKSPRAEEKKAETRDATANDQQVTTDEIKEAPEATEPTDPAQTSEQIVPESSTEQTEDKKKKEKSNILMNIGRRISSSVTAKRQNSLSAQESTQEKVEPTETAETQEPAVASAIDATDENADKIAEKEPETAVQKHVIPEGIKSGTIQKQSQFFKQFNHRYFVLTKDKKLHYYRSQNDASTEKVIELSADCKVKIIEGNKFDLETTTRTYRFIADSGEDRDSWIKELKELGVSSEESQSTSADKLEEAKKLEVTKSENDDDFQQSIKKAADAVEASVTEGQETTTTTAAKAETVETVVVTGETTETTEKIEKTEAEKAETAETAEAAEAAEAAETTTTTTTTTTATSVEGTKP